MNVRCSVLSFLRIHRADCELCNASGKNGEEIRKRLEELNMPLQPRSFKNKNNDDPRAVEVLDSETAEVGARPPTSLKAKKKKKIA